MGVEVVGFEMAQVPVEAVTESDFLHKKENGKLSQESVVNEPIKFGSHGEEPVKGEENNVSDANFPKDAVDEWPAPKQIHSFFFVRYRPYDDPKIKVKIDQADKEIQRRNQARFQLTEELRSKRSDRAEIITQVRSLKVEGKQFKSILDEKKKEMEPLQQALGKLRSTNGAGRSGGICSSEEELNDLIHSLHYRMQHESIPLAEEKQLLREIKQLEGTREKVTANANMRAKIQDSLGQKEAIQDQVKLIGGDLDGVRKEQQAVWTKINRLEEKLKAVDAEISSLQEELTSVTQKRDKAYETIQELRKQRDEGNAYFYQSRTLLSKARELAAKKDLQALEELSNTEVDKFMSLWCHNKAIRDDYEKRILPSLDSRQLSRDGRMRNPDERPLVVSEAPMLSEADTAPKPIVKRPKEDAKPAPQPDALPTTKAQKEPTKEPTNSKLILEQVDVVEEDIFVVEKPQKDPPKEEELDPAKLKEMKREEEIAKAKQAMERKKKLAEKAAAKAAIRAQKEAEKKLKEREKKAKKKAASSSPPTNSEETTEAVAEALETEKVEVKEEAPVPVKEKVHKENHVRYRGRAKGPESLPKAILKRKKSTNYWVWAAPAALIVLIILVLGYFYLI